MPHSYWRCPLIATQAAYRHHVAPSRPCRRFTRRASSGPTFPHPCRRVSYDTMRPRSASRSSTSWKLRPYLCYTQTAWLMLSGGTRCRRSRNRRECAARHCAARSVTLTKPPQYMPAEGGAIPITDSFIAATDAIDWSPRSCEDLVFPHRRIVHATRTAGPGPVR